MKEIKQLQESSLGYDKCPDQSWKDNEIVKDEIWCALIKFRTE
jgi:hypothetical protein